VQQNILVAQGILTTVLALLFAFVPAVSNAYWIFMTITTSVYLLMYLASMFVAAYNLRKRRPDHPRAARAGPDAPLRSRLLSSLAAILISFVPPRSWDPEHDRVPVLRRRRDHPARRHSAALPLAPQAELEDRGAVLDEPSPEAASDRERAHHTGSSPASSACC
jgi:hypothetical protein